MIPYRVLDDLFSWPMLAAAAAAWPAPDWDGWYRYDRPDEQKLACDKWELIPEPCRQLLGELAILDGLADMGGRCVPDLTLHGAGMHSMTRGGFLGLHLDADRHPRTGMERRCNVILFLTEVWDHRWGGALELWAASRERCEAEVWPKFGRIVVFATGDESYHAVRRPLECPAGVQRQTLALYFWGRPRGPARRPRALFVSPADEIADAVLEQARRERAGLAS